jgi:mono/diheme cytochrome c family protein
MKNFKSFLTGTTILVIYLSLVSLNVTAQPKPWTTLPANCKTVKNPVAKGEAGNKAGMALYNKNCASCHGKAGLGDGVKARALKEFPGDFSGAEFQNQTDGEHFFKTKLGRGDMPKYEGKLTDDDIWDIVNFMRTLKK